MKVKTIIGGTTAALLLTGASVAFAQTTTYATPTDATVSSDAAGLPNTGAGGDATKNALLLGSGAALALFGAATLLRPRAERM